MDENNRRDFIRKSGLLFAPFLIPAVGFSSERSPKILLNKEKEIKPVVNFIFDGLLYSPEKYIKKLQEIDTLQSIRYDMYGEGGATQILEEAFVKLTGKEKAIYLPSGTMANQIAIKLLSEEAVKVIVPENSHVYRDEADAAQSVHNKRLVPVGKGKPFFSLDDLKEELKYIENEEVFQSGLKTVVIENPIRRTNGTYIPLETLKSISAYCKGKGLKMHLDGARLHIASAFSNVSIAEYSSCFDTVYISLYKYLNASGGAVLCGDASVIDKVAHHIKILGGTQFQSWCNTAMALHFLTDIETKWKQVVTTSQLLITEFNKIEGLHAASIVNGTNILELKIDTAIDPEKLGEFLYTDHRIWIGGSSENGIIHLTLNESLLTRPVEEIMVSWKDAVKKSKK